MGDKEWSADNVLDVVGDDLARRILVLTSEQPLSADELADCLGTSPPTVYRRVNSLIEYDLLAEHQRFDGEGNHYSTFETTLKRISFEIDDGGYDIDLQVRQNLAGQFESFWSDLEQSAQDDDPGVAEQSTRTDTPEDVHHG